VGDNITTDHIMPAAAKVFRYANIPAISEFVFVRVDPTPQARQREGAVDCRGDNYGRVLREHRRWPDVPGSEP